MRKSAFFVALVGMVALVQSPGVFAEAREDTALGLGSRPAETAQPGASVRSSSTARDLRLDDLLIPLRLRTPAGFSGLKASWSIRLTAGLGGDEACFNSCDADLGRCEAGCSSGDTQCAQACRRSSGACRDRCRNHIPNGTFTSGCEYGYGDGGWLCCTVISPSVLLCREH